MRTRIFLIVLVSLAAAAALAASDYHRHVAFDNSIPPRSYYHSEGSVVSPSELELSNGKFPVEDAECVSPPNCLRLKWRSQRGGEWRMTLNLKKHYGGLDLSGDTLSFWVYSDATSPPTRRRSSTSRTRAVKAALRSGCLAEARRFRRASGCGSGCPFASFVGLFSRPATRFDPARLASITIVQGLDDGAPHTLLHGRGADRRGPRRDDKIRPAAPRARRPGLRSPRGRELASGRASPICCTTGSIDRSTAARTSQSAIQKGHLTRYADFLGEAGREGVLQDQRSGHAATTSRRTVGAASAPHARCQDDELLTMVQEASFRYYWEAAHPEGGHGHRDPAWRREPRRARRVRLRHHGDRRRRRSADSSRASRAAERMLKIVRFLAKADRFHGVWPHFLDGRTGRDHRRTSASTTMAATWSRRRS